jgi:hypothetical protein
MDIYLEIGQKRVFAVAIDWPGWARSGRDEAAAIANLLDHGPRYGRAIAPAGLDFVAPADAAALTIAERLPGGSGTDFGAPTVRPAADARPFDVVELARSEAILSGVWQAFDVAAESAVGVALRKGPRGGGRDLDKIVSHVRESDAAYLGLLGRKRPKGIADPVEEHTLIHREMLDALDAATRGELPERGPRGGTIWRPRFFVRYVAWHTLDHAWEIEDRAIWNAG